MAIPPKSEIGSTISESQPRTERLSDERLANLISAIGNHEAKAITLLVMKPGVLYPPVTGLWTSIMEAQGDGRGWVLDKSLPARYCEFSLAPIGLVARKVEDDLTTYGYIKTEDGENLGVPLAGLLLDFSRRHPDVSLQDVFSATGSSSKLRNPSSLQVAENYKRAPMTRIKIFWELVTSELPINQANLDASLGEYASLIKSIYKNWPEEKLLSTTLQKEVSHMFHINLGRTILLVICPLCLIRILF